MTDVKQYGLGRKIQFDEKSRDFPIMELVAGTVPRSYTWSAPVHLDQGEDPACVGFSWSGELLSRPVVVKGITNATALALYKAAQKLDDQPGEDYEGTTVLAGAKAVKAEGHMAEYRWSFGMLDLILALGHAGPGVLGINWYNDMFTPDSKGFITPTGSLAGGHAILVSGVHIVKASGKKLAHDITTVDLEKSYIRLHNSWGDSWAKGGDAYMTLNNLQKLLDNQGEFCIPVQRS